MKSVIEIPTVYARILRGNYTYAAVLARLATYSARCNDKTFPMTHFEISDHLGISVDQVRAAIRAIGKYAPGVVNQEIKQHDGAPTCHYQVDLIALASLTK